MLRGIRLVNFGNHRDSCLSFGAITALVGRNGAGKTTVLRGIRELARIASPDVQIQDYLDFENAKRRSSIHGRFVRAGESEFGLSTSGRGKEGGFMGQDGCWGFSVKGKFDATKGEDEVLVEPQWWWKPGPEMQKGTWLPDVGVERFLSDAESANRFADLKEKLKHPVEGTNRNASADQPDQVAMPERAPRKEWLGELTDHQYLHGVGVNLNRPSYTAEIPPRLTTSGDNLPSVIAYLMTSEPERFDELSDAFRQLIPFVKRIRVRPAKVKKRESRVITVNKKDIAYPDEIEYSGHELLLDLTSGKGVPASVVSEGTLLILALLTIFHTSDSPRLVLIDDVEQALHPWAQRQLVSHFRSLQKVRTNLQMILTTHSPYIIDELDPSEVWMLAQSQNGFAVAKCLEAHPDLERARGVLTTGEFWSSEGEDWITKG